MMRTYVRTRSAKEVKSMMRLSEFARIYNISERHARRLLQENEADIAGHYDRRGREGTYLDDVAVEVLKNKLQKQYDVMVQQSASDRERELEQQVTMLSMRYAAAMEKLVENAGAVALLEAAKEDKTKLEGRVEQAEKDRHQMEVALEGMRRDAQSRADEALVAEEKRIEAEERYVATEKKLIEKERLLEELATAGFWQRRKILKNLKKSKE